jgi:transposase
MSEPSLDLVPNLVRRRKSNGRCVYDKAAKRELVRRCLLPGVSLARTALEHGLNANLLRKWVVKQTGTRLARRRGMLAAVSPVALLPVTTQESGTLSTTAPSEGYLELLLSGGTIRVHGRVPAEVLSMAVDCLARRT